MQKILGILLLVLACSCLKPCQPLGPRVFYGKNIQQASSSEKLAVYFNTFEACESSYLQLVKKAGLVKVPCSTMKLSLSQATGNYQAYVHRCATENITYEETFHYNPVGWDGSSADPVPFKDYNTVTLADPFNKSRKMKWVVLADWSKIEKNSFKYTAIDNMLLQVQKQQKIDGMLILGDIGYDLDTNNCSNYQKFLIMLAETAGSLPIVIVTGNHEYNTEDNWKLYSQSFQLYSLEKQLAVGLSLGSFYLAAFDPTKLLYTSPGQFQTDDDVAIKFTAILEKAKMNGQFILPTSHYPLACSGSSKFCSKDRSSMSSYWNVMLNNGISLYLGAHYHSYQRIYPYTKGDKFIKQAQNYTSDGGYLITIVEGVAGNDKDIVEAIETIESYTAAYTINQTGFGILQVSPSLVSYRHLSTKSGEMDRMDIERRDKLVNLLSE